jgi:hypothetical protein
LRDGSDCASKKQLWKTGKLVGLLSSADLAAEIKEELTQFIDLEEAFAKHS